MSDSMRVYREIDAIAFWRDRDQSPCFYWMPVRAELPLNRRILARVPDFPSKHPVWVPEACIVARRWPEDWT